MRILKLCFMSVAATLLLFQSATAETLVFDDFEGDSELEWPDVPAITIEKEPGNPDNTVLVFDTRNDQTNADALFLEGFEDLTDYTMRAKFNIIGETAEFAAIGLIVRAQSVTEYMLVEPARKRLCCGAPRENVLNVFERGAAGWPIVADPDIDIELNEWHELSVTVADKKLTVLLDGKQVAEYGKVPYPKGGFGIREWRSQTLIDDVEIYDKDGSSLAVEARDKLAVKWGALKAGQ
ncbi:LamG domain-containing protein [Candidatus Poribacteria bacterium]|nr:LamG domain-containing protein [Candidatus Poribacteria bacterium]MYK18664.1 LamG domain-containing protein [Candidatus Poribacteria bacterium]